jgi:hypothetical protein
MSSQIDVIHSARCKLLSTCRDDILGTHRILGCPGGFEDDYGSVDMNGTLSCYSDTGF